MRQNHTTGKKGVRRGENIGDKIYMSGPVTDEESKEGNVISIAMEKFEPVTSKNTLFFSTYEPEYVFKQVIGKLEDRDLMPVVSDKKWKLTFDKFREQDEEELNAELPVEGCKVQVKLLMVDDDKICVEFSRVGGSSWYFYEQFKMLKD